MGSAVPKELNVHVTPLRLTVRLDYPCIDGWSQENKSNNFNVFIKNNTKLAREPNVNLISVLST